MLKDLTIKDFAIIEDLSIEEIYALTGGKVGYEKAREAISFISKLSHLVYSFC